MKIVIIDKRKGFVGMVLGFGRSKRYKTEHTQEGACGEIPAGAFFAYLSSCRIDMG